MRSITQIDKEALKVLNDYNLYRLCDNFLVMQQFYDGLGDKRRYGVIYFVPQSVSESGLTCDNIVNKDLKANYTNDMNGYLIYKYISYSTENNNKEDIIVFEPVK